MRPSDLLSIPCLADAITRVQVRCFKRRHREPMAVVFAINRPLVHAPARCQARLRELIRLEVARYRQ